MRDVSSLCEGGMEVDELDDETDVEERSAVYGEGGNSWICAYPESEPAGAAVGVLAGCAAKI